MEFFDSLITELGDIIGPLEKNSFLLSDSWHDAEHNQIIMRRDTAFELDGVGFNLVTSKEAKDEIIVIGDDLGKIDRDMRFTRIAVIEIKDVEDEQELYKLIKKIEYIKYHFFPDGYMMRTASRSHKESVRVSKSAVKSGISFCSVGSLMIKKLKENPAVKGVKLIFITNPDADFEKTEKLAIKNYKITETFNHIMNNITFDCDSCNLKPICDEVEGMKELHFKQSKMN